MISFVLVEKFTTAMGKTQILFPLISFWNFVDEVNNLIRAQEDELLITIDLNPIVCADE
jgi:hypothetical protein